MAKAKKEDNPLEDLKAIYKDRVHMGGDLPSARENPINTGSIYLNAALGIGGYAKGRVIECFGKEGTGKTALGLIMLSNVEGAIALIDAEKSYEVTDAIRYGVNMKNFLVLKPDSAEDAMEMACDLAKHCKAIVFDSISGMATIDELEKGIAEHTMGSKANKMSVLMRRYPSITEKHGCTTYFVNQIRDNIGGYGGVVTPGGHALKFAATVRMQITRIEKFPTADKPEGHYIHMHIIKNKLSTPYKKVKIPFLYGQGLSKELEILEIAIAQKILTVKGAWINYGEVSVGQGRKKARLFLEDNVEICDEIYSKIDLNDII